MCTKTVTELVLVLVYSFGLGVGFWVGWATRGAMRK